MWLAQRGVPMAYHHHMGTIVRDPSAMVDLLMNYTGEAVGLLLDTGHLAFAAAMWRAPPGATAGGSTTCTARTCGPTC